MSRNIIITLPLIAALAACGTPQEQCIRKNTKELRVVSDLLAEVEGNLARGYAWQERSVTRTEWVTCRDVVPDKDGEPIVVTRACLRDISDTEHYRVAIDPAPETRKRDNLAAQKKRLEKQAAAAISACKKAYPETD